MSSIVSSKNLIFLYLVWLLGLIGEKITANNIAGISSLNPVFFSTLIFQMIIFSGSIIVIRNVSNESSNLGSHMIKWALKTYLLGFGIILLFSTIIQISVSTILDTNPTAIITSNIENGTDLLLFLIVGVVGAPIVEELFFRRLLIPTLEKMNFTPTLAVFISSFIFSSAHWVQNIVAGSPDIFVGHLISSTFYGVVFGFVFVKTRNVRYTVILHMLNNLIGFISLALQFYLPYSITELQEFITGNNGSMTNELQMNLIINLIFEISVVILAFSSAIYGIRWIAQDFVRRKSKTTFYIREIRETYLSTIGNRVITSGFIVFVIFAYAIWIGFDITTFSSQIRSNISLMVVSILSILSLPLIIFSPKVRIIFVKIYYRLSLLLLTIIIVSRILTFYENTLPVIRDDDILILFFMVLTLNLIIYNLLILRTNTLPKTTIVIATILTLIQLSIRSEGISGLAALPQILLIIELGFIVIELTIFIFIISKTTQIIRNYRSDSSLYLVNSVEDVLIGEHVKNVRPYRLLISELLMIYYSVAGWFIKLKTPPPGYRSFTYHKKSNAKLFMLVFIFVVMVEVPLLHLLISQWSNTAAWILTILGIYSLFWIVGDYNAVRLNPIYASSETLHLRIGLRWYVEISYENIVSVTNYDKKVEGVLKISTGYKQNTIIEFTKPTIIQGMFGFEKTSTKVALCLDNPSTFMQFVQRRKLKNS